MPFLETDYSALAVVQVGSLERQYTDRPGDSLSSFYSSSVALGSIPPASSCSQIFFPSHYSQRMQSSDRLALGPTPTSGAGGGVAFLLTQCVWGGAVGGGSPFYLI